MIELIEKCTKTKIRNKAKLQYTIHKTVDIFVYSTSVDTKGPLNPASERNHNIYIIVYQFSSYTVTEPTPKKLFIML